MVELLGLIAAFISALGWGSNFVFLKKMEKPNLFQFHSVMSAGIFLSTLSFLLVLGMPFIVNPYGILSGLSWGVANLISIYAIRYAGLSRAVPVWMVTGLTLSFMWGILILNEAFTSLVFAVAGIILFVIGAPFVSAKDGEKGTMKGILLALIAGIIFSFYVFPYQFFSMQKGEFLLSASIGILITGIVLAIIKYKEMTRTGASNALASGLVWNVSSLSSLYAVSYLGIALGIPLTQMALVISAAWGILYFKEIKGKALRKVVLGIILLFAGSMALTIAKL